MARPPNSEPGTIIPAAQNPIRNVGEFWQSRLLDLPFQHPSAILLRIRNYDSVTNGIPGVVHDETCSDVHRPLAYGRQHAGGLGFPFLQGLA